MTATATHQIPLHSERTDPPGTVSFARLPGQFCLHYQPQLDLRTGAIDRCEALLRWWHPEHGLLRPHSTLGGTRWIDDLDELDSWALEEVCRQGAAWRKEGVRVQVAMNVSTSFLLSAAFPSAIDRALCESGLAAQDLAIDVPYGALVTEPHWVRAAVGDLVGAGVGVIVDGVVGDDHPWVLDRLGAGTWKIAISHTALGGGLHPSVSRAREAAHQAGAQAVAKAVEHDADLVALRALGFDGVFGTVLSPPVRASEARQVLRPAPLRLPSPFTRVR